MSDLGELRIPDQEIAAILHNGTELASQEAFDALKKDLQTSHGRIFVDVHPLWQAHLFEQGVNPNPSDKYYVPPEIKNRFPAYAQKTNDLFLSLHKQGVPVLLLIEAVRDYDPETNQIALNKFAQNASKYLPALTKIPYYFVLTDADRPSLMPGTLSHMGIQPDPALGGETALRNLTRHLHNSCGLDVAVFGGGLIRNPRGWNPVFMTAKNDFDVHGKRSLSQLGLQYEQRRLQKDGGDALQKHIFETIAPVGCLPQGWTAFALEGVRVGLSAATFPYVLQRTSSLQLFDYWGGHVFYQLTSDDLQPDSV